MIQGASVTTRSTTTDAIQAELHVSREPQHNTTLSVSQTSLTEFIVNKMKRLISDFHINMTLLIQLLSFDMLLMS